MAGKKRGPDPIENPQKSRTLRLDDDRWKFFREHLGSEWLRAKVDAEIKRYNAKTAASKSTN